MGRRIGRGIWLAALAAIVAAAPIAVASDRRAAEQFRAAAALEQRALYDLAAAEYATLIADHAADPLAHRARLRRGICLFQLARYDEARTQLRELTPPPSELDAAQVEELLAYLGLAEYNLGRVAEGAQRSAHFDAALATLEQHRAAFPQGGHAEQTAFYRAEALYARGKVAAAIDVYRALLTQYPEHPRRADALYALGVAELERECFAEAAQTFEMFGREYPDHAAAADARRSRGDALLAHAIEQLDRNGTQETIAATERLLAEFPESQFVPPALVALARAQVQATNWDAAEATLSRFLEPYPRHKLAAQAESLRAQVRYERGDFVGAITDANAALENGTSRAAHSHLRGLCEQRLGKPADAARTLQQIVDSEPQYSALDRVLYDLAWAYQDANEPAQSTAVFARLVESCPTSPLAAECHYRVGEARHAAGDLAAAATSFRGAADSASDATLCERALHRLACCQFEQGGYEAAWQTFHRQVVDSPHGSHAAAAQILAAECRFQQRRYDDALAEFAAALERPGGGESLRAMALAHAAQAAVELGEWARCLGLSDRLVREFPQNNWVAATRAERGTALFELQQLDEAEREFVALAANDSGVVAIRADFMLGEIHQARKRHDDAVRAYFKAAYGHGGGDADDVCRHWRAEAVFAAARTLEQTGRSDAARTLYQELVDRYPTSARAALARESLERTAGRNNQGTPTR